MNTQSVNTFEFKFNVCASIIDDSVLSDVRTVISRLYDVDTKQPYYFTVGPTGGQLVTDTFIEKHFRLLQG